MTDPALNPEDLLKKITRRYMLRNASMAATGFAFLPAFLEGCKKNTDAPEENVNVGGAQGSLTPQQLQAAAANLTRMRNWISDLYPLCVEYEDAVFHALASTKQNPSWTNFIVDVFLDIAAVLAAAGAIASGGGAAVPAFVFLSSILHDWGIGKEKRPSNLDAQFASFQFGHVRMQLAMEQKLSSLVDPKNNYANLVAGWNQPIEFNGKNYTLGDLASSNFPGLGDDYNTLQTAAILSFEKAMWNLAVMKCCTLAPVSNWNVYIYIDPKDNTNPYHNLIEYAQTIMYPQNKGNYLRAGLTNWNDTYQTYVLQSWSLGINGNEFPAEAINILFQDDTPGHIINANGLFPRDYVFKQFALTRPAALDDYFELDPVKGNICNYGGCPATWPFTGGVFPSLTH